MKFRIISAVLTVLVLLLTIVSCVDLPVEESSSSTSREISDESETEISIPSKNESSEQTEESVVSDVSKETSDEEPSSEEEQPSVPDESSSEPVSEPTSEEPVSEESSEEISEEPSEDVSEEPVKEVTDPNAPYQDLRAYTPSTIGTSEYDSYFDNSIFIGHSVMLHFKNYTDYMRSAYPEFLGKSQFFASASFAACHDAEPVFDSSLHPYYKNEKMTCADAVAASGCKTVYVLGMALNELALYGIDGTVNYTAKLFDSIKAKSPDVRIVFLSNTYETAYFDSKYKTLTNDNIRKLNNKMIEYCNTHGIDFIDIASCTVTDGALADNYCIDNEDGGCGCHISRTAYCNWMCVLRNYAYQKKANTFKNPTEMPVLKK